MSNLFLNCSDARLLVVSACTASKRFRPADQLTERELDDPVLRKRGEKRLTAYSLTAAEMYTGQGHKYVREAIGALREKKFSVCHFIISAGYGLLREADLIVPYNVTFSGASKSSIRERGRRLEIREGIIRNAKGFDRIIFILGREYLEAIGLPLPVESLPPVTAYIAPSLKMRIGSNATAITVGEIERRKIGAYSSSAKERRFQIDAYGISGLSL
jgi:hypothetical protein